MKRILFSFLLFLCSSVSMGKTYVLVAAVSNYNDEQNNLTQSTKDAKLFRKVMLTQTKNVSILTSRYANHANIIKKLKKLANAAKKGDRIIFFFSGHGVSGSFVAYDDFVYYSEIISILSQSKATEKVVLIDACHAGSVKNAGNSYEINSDSGLVFIMSSRANESSAENVVLGEGLFTQALVKGLRGKADDDGNHRITIYELFKYVYNDVQNHNPAQHPQLIAPKDRLNSVIAQW